jgi:uncharacterized protein
MRNASGAAYISSVRFPSKAAVSRLSAFDPKQTLAFCKHLPLSEAVMNTDALYRIGDAAEEAGNHALALQSFERGAALADESCLFRLALMYDVGELGVAVDKNRAMQLYKRAWRKGNWWAAPNNIAILYRERGDMRTMFQWFKRAAAKGDGSAHLDLAKCYLEGTGVRKNAQSALRCLVFAVSSEHISEAEREQAQALIDTLRPRSV